MKKRDLMINGILLLAILVLLGLVLETGARTRRVQEQNTKRMKEIQQYRISTSQPASLPGSGPAPTPVPPKEMRFTNFGKSNIFDVPIPKPTPVPTPAPTPIPPPALDAVMVQWKLQGISGKTVYLHDEQSGEDFQMEVGGPSRPLMTPSTVALNMTVLSTDETNMTVTFKSDQHEQPYVMKMF